MGNMNDVNFNALGGGEDNYILAAGMNNEVNETKKNCFFVVTNQPQKTSKIYGNSIGGGSVNGLGTVGNDNYVSDNVVAGGGHNYAYADSDDSTVLYSKTNNRKKKCVAQQFFPLQTPSAVAILVWLVCALACKTMCRTTWWQAATPTKLWSSWEKRTRFSAVWPCFFWLCFCF